MKLLSALPFLLLALAVPALAGTVACPDLAAVVQVATCPGEEELQYTFKGYCSDNSRLYDKDVDTDLCVKYENYRERKNIALWESSDGAFSAYLSCDLKPADIRASKPTKLEIVRKNTMTRVICTYAPGVVFTHRTRAECKPAGACDGGGCAATCD
jgi:hypothetical protein